MDQAVRSRDLLSMAQDSIAPFIDRVCGQPETVSVAVLSSASGLGPIRMFDNDSDFDVSVMITIPGWRRSYWRPTQHESIQALQAEVPDWLPSFSFNVSVPWGDLEINVHQLVLEYELDPRTRWSAEKCDVYCHKCSVRYDPRGLLGQLIRDKAMHAKGRFPAERIRLANRLTWDMRKLPTVTSRRSGPEYGHYLVNNAIEELVELIFVVNERFLAARKWRLQTIRTLGLVSDQACDRLTQAMLCEPSSYDDMERRISLIEQVWEEVVERFALPPEDEIHRRQAKVVQLHPMTTADELMQCGAPAPLLDIANAELWKRTPSRWSAEGGLARPRVACTPRGKSPNSG
jgi:hypothetical protein